MANNHSGRIIDLKRRISACARALRLAMLVPLLAVGGSTSVALISNANAAAPANAESEQIAQLLDLLGVQALLEQTPAILATAIDAETQFLVSKPQPANWRRELEAQLKTPLVMQGVSRFLRERVISLGNKGAETLQRAQQRLQEPIAKRARYFDLAMTQPGAEKNLRDFLRQNGLGQNASRKESLQTAQPQADAAENNASAANASRRAVLLEIDTASSSSLLTAALHSAIAARVRQAAGGGAIDAELLRDEIAERQRYLAPLAVDYLLFDYRYLRDDELLAYRDLLRDDSVQWLLDICYQAVLATVAGELKPPPTPQPNPPQ